MTPKQSALTQMLDIIGEPERLTGSKNVQRYFTGDAVASWRPWRAEIFSAARRGRTLDDLMAATPRGTKLVSVLNLLDLHGFVLA